MRRLVLAIFLVTLVVANAGAGNLKRAVPERHDIARFQTAAPTGRIVIKFTDDSDLKVLEHGLVGNKSADLERVRTLLSQKSRGAALERRFDQPSDQLEAQRIAGEKKIHQSLPNLNRYGQLDFSNRGYSRDELIAIVEELMTEPAVETAFLEPKAVPAALGFDAFTGTYTKPELEADPDVQLPQLGDTKDTPDYESLQGYIGAPPQGVNALAAASYPGGLGDGMRTIDIEGAWVWAHEDLPSPFFSSGLYNPDQGWRDHGTAVLGEIAGIDNGFGIRGIAPNVSIGGASSHAQSVPSCIAGATSAMGDGDVIIIELHAPGPNSNGSGQFGYVCMEYWQDNFDAIQVATAAGRVVCEAAGNGSQNLDSATYGSLFDREYRDSGAIMCGAGLASGFYYGFSNYGTRLDLNGWGGNVYTLAYGDLQGPPAPETEWYTSDFSGTSSATPIVAGAILAFQGMIKAYGFEAAPALDIRTLMHDTGSPSYGSHIIGYRPDIIAAYEAYLNSFGTVEGTVTDADTGLPVPDITVGIDGTEQKFTTNGDGQFSFFTKTGLQTLTYAGFHYASDQQMVDIGPDTPADGSYAVTRLPHVDIVGLVSDGGGLGLADARGTITGAPLANVTTGLDGTYTILDVPTTRSFEMLFDNVPGHGADLLNVTVLDHPSGEYQVDTQLIPAKYDFELWWWGYTADNAIWSWGTPVAAPASGFSGEKCWGIGMDGNGYGDNIEDFLNSAQENYVGVEQLHLSFHYWCDLEDGQDGVKFQLDLSVGEWIDLEPLTGYSHERVLVLDNRAAWSGNSGGWQSAIFDLSPYVNSYLPFRFYFASDDDNNTGVFYIDDITFDEGSGATPVSEDPITPRVINPLVTAYPNPFNPTTTIDWSIAKPGDLAIQIYDPRGRLVRTLHNGHTAVTAGQAIFDGRDNDGRGLASGMYLVRIRDNGGLASTTRISLVK